MFRYNFLWLIYLVVGFFVASNHDYFDHINTLKEVIGAIAAVVLWPLVLLGADLHLNVITTLAAS